MLHYVKWYFSLHRIISQLQSAVKTKELFIEQLEEEKKEVIDAVTRPLDEQIRHLQAELNSKDRNTQVDILSGLKNIRVQHWPLSSLVRVKR